MRAGLEKPGDGIRHSSTAAGGVDDSDDEPLWKKAPSAAVKKVVADDDSDDDDPVAKPAAHSDDSDLDDYRPLVRKFPASVPAAKRPRLGGTDCGRGGGGGGKKAATEDESSDDNSSSEDEKPPKKAAPAKKATPEPKKAAAKKNENRDEDSDDSEDEEPANKAAPAPAKKATLGENYVQKWIELCDSDEIKAGAQIEYQKKVGVLKRKEDNTGKTTWVIECISGEPHVGEEYQDPFAFAIDGEDLSYTNPRIGTSFKDERQSFAVKKLIDVEGQAAQKIATEKRRSIRYRAAPPQDKDTKTLKDLLSKSSKNSPTKMPQIGSERADLKLQAASAPGLGGAAGGKGCRFRENEDSTAVKQPIANEKAVGDGVPCSYACAFSS